MELDKLLSNFKDHVFDNMYCSLLAKITEVKTNFKVNVKPVYKIDGEQIAIIPNVPLCSIGNSSSVIRVEPKVGDLVLLVFSDYDIDNFVLSGKIKEINTKTMHQLNDAIAIQLNLTAFNSTESYTSKVTIKNNGDVVIESNTQIKLGENATESVPLGDVLKTWLDNHTHGGGASPDTSSPSPSSKVVVE